MHNYTVNKIKGQKMTILGFSTRYKEKIHAYKKMRCNQCKQDRIFYELRGLQWFHLFFIPLIPVGSGKIWECSHCRRHQKDYIISNFWLYIMIILGVLSLFGASGHSNPSDNASIAFFVLAGFFSVLVLVQRSRDTEKYLPLDNTKECLLCNSELKYIEKNRYKCKRCAVEVFDAKKIKK